jgi:hypothetical protein
MDRWEVGGEVGLSDSREAVRNGAEAKPMLIVHVHVHAKPESVENFRQTNLASNAPWVRGMYLLAAGDELWPESWAPCIFVGKAATHKVRFARGVTFRNQCDA